MHSYINTLEIFNELSLISLTYILLLFTDFNGDEVKQYNAGWALIAITIFNIAVNMIVNIILVIKGII